MSGNVIDSCLTGSHRGQSPLGNCMGLSCLAVCLIAAIVLFPIFFIIDIGYAFLGPVLGTAVLVGLAAYCIYRCCKNRDENNK